MGKSIRSFVGSELSFLKLVSVLVGLSGVLQYLCQMYAWEAFSSLADVLFRGYHPVPFNR